MSLALYYHPLASYCWKALVGLYELGAPFTPRFVDLSDATQRAELAKLWPFAKFPVLRDDARDQTIPEATILLEYLSQHHAGAAPLVPGDPDRARETRARDRFFDLYVHEPMQKIVGDRIRPADAKDPYGVEQARATLETAYGVLEPLAGKHTWAMGEAFTLADCAACPALYYANRVHPFGGGRKNVAAYLERLVARPSFARVLGEAEPYFKMFPG
jgi:glutathione S-transferase